MVRSPRGLLTHIEEGALDSTSPLADVLRRCVALGGRAGSEQLRDWARRELDGYGDGEQELPAYRRVPAIICINGSDLAKIVTGQQISVWDLPEFARESIKQEAPLGHGVAELERLAARAESVQLQDFRMPDLVKYMNSRSGYGTAIHTMYWKVDPTSIHGVLDTIRTTLVSLVAEMRATGGDEEPSAEAADQAVNVVVHGAKRSRITVNTNQASSGGGPAGRQAIDQTQPIGQKSRLPGWIRGPWAFAVGVATIVAGATGVAVWMDWSPFN